MPQDPLSRQDFVEGRLEELRRDQWGAWCMLAVVGGMIVIVAIGLGVGWSRSVLVPALLMFGIPQVSTIYQLVRNAKLITLYELLHRLDGKTESAVSMSTS